MCRKPWEAQDLATGMPAAAPGLRAGQRAWWPHPQRVTPWEELGARRSSTFLPNLLRGDGAGQFAEGSDVCPRQMGWPPSTAPASQPGLGSLVSFRCRFPSVCLPLLLSSHSGRRFCSLTSQRSPERSAAGARVLSAPEGHLGSVGCSLCTCLKCFS